MDDNSGWGRSAALADSAERATEERALVVALGIVLRGYEARANDSAWRENGGHSSTGRYLRFLVANGYVLSEVEAYAAGVESV